jgi:hypothetical protein
MEWNSLISAVIGGLLAVIPVLLTIRNQSVEREKDRREQRREAKFQLMGRLKERDINIVMDACDLTVRAMRELRALSGKFRELEEQVKSGKIEEQEKEVKKDDLHKKLEETYAKMREAHSIGFGRLYALDEDITKVYDDFENIATRIEKFYTESSQEDIVSLWPKMYKYRGELQNLLTRRILSAYTNEIE